MAYAVGDHTFNSSRRVALVSLATILLLAASGLVFTLFALNIQSAARAYVTGNGLWSKGQYEATYYLFRYSHSGNPDHLQQARQALAVPLGDHKARLALNKSPPDIETARKGFLQGGNHPEDLDDLIWLYRNFSAFPFFSEAIDIWQRADEHIMALQSVARELEQAYAKGSVSAGRLSQLRERLAEINKEIRPLDRAFSETLNQGVRYLRSVLIFLSVVVLSLICAGATAIFIWATRSIASTENKFQATFHHAAVGMAQLSPDETFMDVNDSLCRVLGYDRSELLNMNLMEITHEEDRNKDADDYRELMKSDLESYTVEKRLLCRDGSISWCKLTLSRVGQYLDVPRYIIAVIEDISEARRLSTELSHQATHDALTNTINRAEFETRMRETIRNASVESVNHTLCFLDLDQFKIINDTCGHIAGDALLQQVTEMLRQNLRRGDTLARLGGDEFGIIFSACEINSARGLAEKLRSVLSDFVFMWEGATFNITASIGLVEIDETANDPVKLLREADTACYTAKDQGRNQIHIYNDMDLAVAARRNEMEWVSRVREAVSKDRLQIWAQLIQSLRRPSELRYEVLVRLIDNDGTLIMPDAFLPAAERYNVATLIDRWVVKTTLSQLEQCPDHLSRLSACHINLSGQSISREDFHHFVQQVLDDHDVPANRICFEITETAAVSNMTEARKFIGSIGRRGCTFALDDFGSGLSSFGYLRSLPVDILKIDGSFVRNMDADDIHHAMVRSICEIGSLMNKQTVAEFVESDAIVTQLREMNVDYAQGYAIHKPVLLDALLSNGANIMSRKI